MSFSNSGSGLASGIRVRVGGSLEIASRSSTTTTSSATTSSTGTCKDCLISLPVTNLGTGTDVFAGKTTDGVGLQFKSIIGQNGLIVFSDDSSIYISATGSGGGSGSVTSVTAGSGLSGGVITTSGTISLPSVTTAGSYTNANITVDQYGRITQGSSGAGTSLTLQTLTTTLNTVSSASSYDSTALILTAKNNVLIWLPASLIPGGSGSGAITSVAGRTGIITLTHTDLTDWNTATASFLTSNAVSSVAGKTGVITLAHTDLTDWNTATSSFLTNNAITTVAGRTGAIVLTHTDISDWTTATSGLGGGSGTNVSTLPVITTIDPNVDTLVVNQGGEGGTSSQMTANDLLNGQTIDQASVAGAVSDSDTFWVGQGSSSMVGQTFSAVWTWIAAKLLTHLTPIVSLNATTDLTASAHNNRTLVATQAITVTASTFASLGSGFHCVVVAQVGTTTFGTGITGLATLTVGQRCNIDAYTTTVGSVVLATLG